MKFFPMQEREKFTIFMEKKESTKESAQQQQRPIQLRLLVKLPLNTKDPMSFIRYEDTFIYNIL